MTDVGLIGIGYIGEIFLDALMDTEHDVTVFDIDKTKVQNAVDKGASAANGPAEIGRETDVIMIAVPGTPEVEDVMEGENGLLNILEGDQLVIDATTTLPKTSVIYEEKCAERDIRFIEAPITGGSPRDGYHMMIGGTEENYSAAAEILDVVCADHKRIGEAGKAMIFKLGLQMRYSGHHAIDAEIVEFARDNDVDPELYNDFLEMGIFDKYFTEDFSQDLEGLGGLAIWNKDIGYARQVAHENQTALPLNGVVHEAYKATIHRISEDEGHAATLIKYWKMLNDAENRNE